MLKRNINNTNLIPLIYEFSPPQRKTLFTDLPLIYSQASEQLKDKTAGEWVLHSARL